MAHTRRLVKGVVHGIGDYGNCLGAVSYTHLRAHETVLDLVCRLLLEKKNEDSLANSDAHTRKLGERTELVTR